MCHSDWKHAQRLGGDASPAAGGLEFWEWCVVQRLPIRFARIAKQLCLPCLAQRPAFRSPARRPGRRAGIRSRARRRRHSRLGACPPQRNGALIGLSAHTAPAAATSIYLRYEGDSSGQDNMHTFTASVRMTW